MGGLGGVVLGFLLVALTPQAEVPQEKLEVPKSTDLRKAKKEIQGIFGDEFAIKSRDARSILAKKLLAQADDSANTPSARYAALEMARELSLEAFDCETGFAAVDTLERLYKLRSSPITGATFSINLNLHKARYLLDARKQARAAADISIIAAAFMSLAEQALKDEAYDDASSFAKQAGKASKDPWVVSRAKQFAKTVPSLKSERDAGVKARVTLVDTPDDPKANHALGIYLLFVKHQEESGLGHLAKGPESPLRDVAIRELDGPSTPEALMAIGEAWLALSKKERSPSNRVRYESRAIRWLQQAFEGSGGLARAKVKKRLMELGWIEEPSTDHLLGRWSFDEAGGTTIADSSPNGNAGTLMSGVRWTGGASGTALSFDGKGSYVSCKASGLQFADNPQTMAWAQLVMRHARGKAVAIVLTSEKSSLVLGLGYRDGKVAVWHTNSILVQAAPPSPRDWHYFAYTYDGSTHKLYVDGVLKASSTLGTMAGRYQMLEFGRWYGGYPAPDGKPEQFFQGNLDDIRIYKRALSESEIRDLVRVRKK